MRNAGLVVAVVVPDGRMPFDAGRAAQNMLLAAWNDGIDATPNGLEDADAAREILEIAEGEAVAIVLSFGRPSHPREPGGGMRGLGARANRRSPSSSSAASRAGKPETRFPFDVRPPGRLEVWSLSTKSVEKGDFL